MVLSAIAKINSNKRMRLRPELVESLLDELSVPVGSKVADAWDLPSQVKESTAYHREYDQAPVHRYEAKLTYMATLLAKHVLNPKAFGEKKLRREKVITALNLYPEDIDDLLTKADKVRESVRAMSQ